MGDIFSMKLRAMHPALFVLFLLGLSYALELPLVLLQSQFESLQYGDGSPAIQSADLLGRLFIGSLLGPLVETALFQWAPVRLLHTKLRLPWPLVIFASASLFAITHAYSVGYVVFAFLFGLVLAYGFVVRDGEGQSPFFLVFLVHAIRNGIASLLN